jgi:hypothetical protein
MPRLRYSVEAVQTQRLCHLQIVLQKVSALFIRVKDRGVEGDRYLLKVVVQRQIQLLLLQRLSGQ